MKVSRVITTTLASAFVVLACMCILPAALFDFIATLSLGWMIYLGRVLPQVSINIGGVVSAVLSVIALTALAHGMASWMWRETRDPSSIAWKRQWTASILAIVVLMFVAGIGAVGATHQTVWLLKSEEPLTRTNSSRANRVKCGSNLRQIGAAIQLYAAAHDKQLPDKLATLMLTEDITPEVFVCPASDDMRAEGSTPEQWVAHMGEGTLSYVYYGRGLKFPLPPDRVLASEPLIDHDGEGLNVLYADGHVDWLDPEHARQVLAGVGE